MQLARTRGVGFVVAVLIALFLVAGLARSAAADDKKASPKSRNRPPAESPAPEVAAPAPATPAPATPATEEAPATPSTSNLTARASLDVGGYMDSTATSVLTPSLGVSVDNPTAGWGVSGRYLVDVVSAASPDIIATASTPFKEVRHAGNLGFRYKPGLYGVAVAASTSYTPDYLALSAGATFTQEVDEKNLTLVESYGYGHDTIGRTGTPFSIFSRTLDYHSLSLGASRVVNPGLVVGLYGDAILERGDQSKPYRYIPVFSPADAPRIPVGASVSSVANKRIQARPLEQLPLDRDRFALTGKLAWRGDSTTFRMEERVYSDSWSQHASTTDVRYFVDVSRRLTIWPHGRFNIQNGVSFWKRAYSGTTNDLPALRTGDRELSPLFTFGGGGGLRLALGGAGAIDDVVLTTTLDGFYTSFSDAIYVTQRYSVLANTGLEVTF